MIDFGRGGPYKRRIPAFSPERALVETLQPRLRLKRCHSKITCRIAPIRVCSRLDVVETTT